MNIQILFSQYPFDENLEKNLYRFCVLQNDYENKKQIILFHDRINLDLKISLYFKIKIFYF